MASGLVPCKTFLSRPTKSWRRLRASSTTTFRQSARFVPAGDRFGEVREMPVLLRVLLVLVCLTAVPECSFRKKCDRLLMLARAKYAAPATRPARPATEAEAAP